nr:disease resistance protein RPP13-like [Ziziphus jujuba var. spinosa]
MGNMMIPVVLLQNYLTKLLKDEAHLLSGVKGQVRSIQDDLQIMISFGKDYVGKQNNDDTEKVLEQITEVALDVEDIIDTYLERKLTIKQRWLPKNLLSNPLHFFSHVKALSKASRKTRSINEDIKGITDKYAANGIEEGQSGAADTEAKQLLGGRHRPVSIKDGSGEAQSSAAGADDVDDDDDMVGFEDQTESLVNRLTDRKNSQRDVVSIIGMGGLGKTTLANKIFTLVKDRFDCYAWVHVSQAYQKRRLFLDMLKCFGSNFSDEIYSNKSDEDLVVEIRDYLRGKRYFAVMDDVWETQVWDEVKAALPDDENGSRILITGRHKDIASHASSSGSTPPYLLPFLNEDESLQLLSKKVALVRTKSDFPSNFENLGKQVVERCKGLPLSITELGMALANKWNSCPRSDFIDFLVDEYSKHTLNRCLDSVALSYNNLPYHLKPCFLYLGVFPEDFEIKTKMLTELWIAEGIIVQHTGNTNGAYVAAEFYLEELINRSLIQVVSRRDLNGSVKSCRVHSSVRDFCIKQSLQEKFFEVQSMDNLSSRGKIIRRHSVDSKTNPYYCVFWNACDTSSARSFLLFSSAFLVEEISMWEWLLEGFKFIRVLVLLFDNTGHDLGISFPKGMQNLIFLRYLKMRGFITKDHERLCYQFFDSICNLQFLETIDVQFDSEVEVSLPGSIWKMTKLRHLSGYKSIKLPKPPRQLVEKGTNKLCNLQALAHLYVDGTSAGFIAESKFPNLTYLGLYYKRDESDGLNESEMTQPVVSLEKLPYLQRLSIVGFKKYEPRLEFSASSTLLTQVKLKKSFVDSNLLSILGKLPNLHALKIKLDKSYIDNELDVGVIRIVEGGFPQLRVFKLIRCGFKMWEMDEGAMPKLQYLVMIKNEEIEALPDQLWCMEGLRRVELSSMSRRLTYSLSNLAEEKVEISDIGR